MSGLQVSFNNRLALALYELLEAFLLCLCGLEPPAQLLYYVVFALHERSDKLSLLVCLGLLPRDGLDLLVNELHFLAELLRLRILAVEVPPELGHQD